MSWFDREKRCGKNHPPENAEPRLHRGRRADQAGAGECHVIGKAVKALPEGVRDQEPNFRHFEDGCCFRYKCSGRRVKVITWGFASNFAAGSVSRYAISISFVSGYCSGI